MLLFSIKCVKAVLLPEMRVLLHCITSDEQHCRVGLNAIFRQKLQSFLCGGAYQNFLLGFLKI